MTAEELVGRDAYELADALLEVLHERMQGEGLSVNRLAGLSGIQQPTLLRKLRAQGRLTVDEWDRVAVALGEPGLEALLEAARRRV